MKKLVLVVLCVVSVVSAVRAGVVTGFNDIVLWAGSGTNRSALVVDFHDGSAKQSFAWGFRWSGNATGYDMITAIDQAWTELAITSPAFVTNIAFSDLGTLHAQSAGLFSTYPDDWTSWGYYLAGGTATQFDSNPPYGPVGTLVVPGGGTALPSSWTVSPSGSSDRFLANGSWDALSFGSVDLTFTHQSPPGTTTYAAVPEPNTLALLALGGLAYAIRKRLYPR